MPAAARTAYQAAELRTAKVRFAALQRLGYMNLCPADQESYRCFAATLRRNGINPATGKALPAR